MYFAGIILIEGRRTGVPVKLLIESSLECAFGLVFDKGVA